MSELTTKEAVESSFLASLKRLLPYAIKDDTSNLYWSESAKNFNRGDQPSRFFLHGELGNRAISLSMDVLSPQYGESTSQILHIRDWGPNMDEPGIDLITTLMKITSKDGIILSRAYFSNVSEANPHGQYVRDHVYSSRDEGREAVVTYAEGVLDDMTMMLPGIQKAQLVRKGEIDKLIIESVEKQGSRSTQEALEELGLIEAVQPYPHPFIFREKSQYPRQSHSAD